MNSDLVVVVHIPKFISKLTCFFLIHGGHIKFEITGVKKYSKDTEQGGLEIADRLTISNSNKRMANVMKEKLNPSLRSTEKLTVKQNSFSLEYLVYFKLCSMICSFLAYYM